MGLLKQAAAAVAIVAVAGAVWLRLDPSAGAALLSPDSALPAALRPVVAAIAPEEPEATIGATPRASGAPQTPLVVVDAARPETTRDRLSAIGTGEAERTVAVYPEATGLVTEVGFRAGDSVSRGDVLLRLEDDNERLALDRARIALDAAEAQVERYRALSSSAAITTVQFEEVQRTLETARLDLRGAEIALDRRSVVAPIDGHVGLSAVEVGALVGNQTLIATIDDRDRLKVVFLAPEAFVSDLAVGAPLQATPATRTGRSYSGEISALDSRLDETSRTLRVEALIDNASDDLRPGLSFGIEIAFPGEEFLSVDPLAVQWERAGPFVWVVEDGTARKAPLRIVERNVDRVLVASETLEADDSVVVEGIQSLRDGVAVRVLNVQDAPAPGGEETAPVAARPGTAEALPERRAQNRAGAAAAAETAR